MYHIDLLALAKCSALVTMSSFESFSSRSTKATRKWLTKSIKKKVRSNHELAKHTNPNWEKDLERALNEVWTSEILMPQGPSVFTQQVADFVLKNRQKRPIYPVINDRWKSDAWLTGLMLGHLADPQALNPEGRGFAVTARAIPEPLRGGHPAPDTFDLLYLDDASYSGTQVFNLLNSISTSGLKPLRIFLMFAGWSTAATGRKQHAIKLHKTRQRHSGFRPVMDFQITKMMRLWAPSSGVLGLLRGFFGTTDHIEANPSTLAPQITQGQNLLFDQNCLAILPYKIPDSVSVPTHLYLAYDPATRKSHLKKGHVFKGDGKVTYREIMGNAADSFATKLA